MYKSVTMYQNVSKTAFLFMKCCNITRNCTKSVNTIHKNIYNLIRKETAGPVLLGL